jgi:hypothetical protein
MAAVSAKKTGVWAVVLLALAAFYYFYEIEAGKKRQEATRQQELLFDFQADEVTEVTVKRATETITAVKREGYWQLTAPLSAPGDGAKYREIVRHLAELRYQRLIEERPETLDAFGLTTPSVEIHVRVGEQTPPRVLHIGDKSPTGNGYYVRLADRPAVYLISTMVKDVVDASLHDLRDKTVMVFDPAAVQEMRVTFGTLPPVVLQRQDNNVWQLTAPVQAKADGQQVQTLLQRLRDVKIHAFVAEQPADLATYGLHTPALRFDVVVGKDQAVQTLLLGALDTDRKGVYAKRDDTANVFLLPQAFWESLPKTATALRDKTLLHYDRERITRLELRSVDSQTVITRTAPRQYTLEHPVSAEGDSQAITRLLQELQELRAKDFIAETLPDPEAYGLASPRFQITLWEQATDKEQEVRQHVLSFGDAVPDAQGIYARVAERPTVYLVDQLAAQRLMEQTAFELRNKRILTFDTATIQKIHLQYPASAVTIERDKDAWRLSEPQKQAIRQGWKVDDLLYELSTLEYATIVSENAEDGTPYGLETPQVQITLWRQDGTAIGPLTIGKATDASAPDTRLVFAQPGPQAPLYTVRADFLNALPKTAADLINE